MLFPIRRGGITVGGDCSLLNGCHLVEVKHGPGRSLGSPVSGTVGGFPPPTSKAKCGADSKFGQYSKPGFLLMHHGKADDDDALSEADCTPRDFNISLFRTGTISDLHCR